MNFRKLRRESEFQKNWLGWLPREREWASNREKWIIKKNNINKACERKCRLQKITKESVIDLVGASWLDCQNGVVNN